MEPTTEELILFGRDEIDVEALTLGLRLPLVIVIEMDILGRDELAGTLFDPNVYEMPGSVIQLVERPTSGYSIYGPPHYRRWPSRRSLNHRHRRGTSVR